MKKTSVSLVLTGIIGIIAICIYTGINLSRIIPLIYPITFLIYLFLFGIISLLSYACTDNKSKMLSYILLLTALLTPILNLIDLVTIETVIKFQIAQTMMSFIMITTASYKGIIKILLISCLFFPINMMFGLDKKTVNLLGMVYLSTVFLICIFETLLTLNKKRLN